MHKTFFERQDEARRNTYLLVFYFVSAVIAIIILVYLAFMFCIMGAGHQFDSSSGVRDGMSFWNLDIFLLCFLGTIVVIGLSSLFKLLSLGSGGKSVAEMLGGRIINPSTHDFHERRVLNIVEEMAIASGLSVPPVYLLEDEHGINAFAAGYTLDDAVIGISGGCMRYLNRAEIQGVVAHEFSHILNGDMRLNIRLISILHGILFIALAGRFILNSQRYSGRRYRSDRKEGGAGGILLFGLALLVIGYVGVLFGKLIKAAVSRQREFLADASAVQFTRNPDGIAGALKKIGGLAYGSQIERPNAEEASHMFFATGLAESFSSMLATHPPLVDRISAIERGFDGRFPKVDPQKFDFDGSTSELDSSAQASPSAASPSVAAKIGDLMLNPTEVVNNIGTLSFGHIAYASSLIEQIEQPLRMRTHEPHGAVAVVYALLLDKNADVREKQTRYLAQYLEGGLYEEVVQASYYINQLGEHFRLPLIDMSLPALKELSDAQYNNFKEVVRYLIKADEKCTLFEYALQVVIMRHLEPIFEETKSLQDETLYSLKQVRKECIDLITVLANKGQDTHEKREAAYRKGLEALDFPESTLEAVSTLRVLDVAVRKLAYLSPKEKQRVVKAATACIASDERVTIEEAELLRAICDILGCPLPPFLPSAYAEGAIG